MDSVLLQSFTDFELLIVDDGSTDGTMDSLADLSDPRIRCLAHPTNRGASAARNTGIEAARGTWVAFQDSDDEWLPRKLEKQMARLSAAGPGTVACYCGMATVWTVADAKKRRQNSRSVLQYIPGSDLADVEGDIRAALLTNSQVSTQMLVARRMALLEEGGFDTAILALDDWELAIRLSQKGQFLFVDEPLVVQYFSGNSITRDRSKRARARAQIIAKHAAFFGPHPEILAHHHVSIAGDLRRLGDFEGARRALAEAVRLRPFDPLVRAKAAWVTAVAWSGRGGGGK